MLYPLKFVLTKRLINDDEEDDDDLIYFVLFVEENMGVDLCLYHERGTVYAFITWNRKDTASC